MNKGETRLSDLNLFITFSLSHLFYIIVFNLIIQWFQNNDMLTGLNLISYLHGKACAWVPHSHTLVAQCFAQGHFETWTGKLVTVPPTHSVSWATVHYTTSMLSFLELLCFTNVRVQPNFTNSVCMSWKAKHTLCICIIYQPMSEHIKTVGSDGWICWTFE